MTRETVELSRLTCDGCGTVQLVEVDEYHPGAWFAGAVWTPAIDDGTEWMACSPKCIRKAVICAAEGRTGND